MQTVRIFSDDIGMKFGLEKCAAIKGKGVSVVKEEIKNTSLLRWSLHSLLT